MSKQASRKSDLVISSYPIPVEEAKEFYHLYDISVLSKVKWDKGYKHKSKIPRKAYNELQFIAAQDVCDIIEKGRFRKPGQLPEVPREIQSMVMDRFYELRMLHSRYGFSLKTGLNFLFFESHWKAKGYVEKTKLQKILNQIKLGMIKPALEGISVKKESLVGCGLEYVDAETDEQLSKELGEGFDLADSYMGVGDGSRFSLSELQDFAQGHCKARGEHPTSKFLEQQENPARFYHPDYWVSQQ